jgi:cellulose biosynthesis protein BcsQ
MVSSLRVVTVASNKGGVGKTTIATNLAVYLRALREELPILVLGLDDQDMIQRMFALDTPAAPEADVLDALRARSLAPAIRLGQYGVHYVPPSPTLCNEACGIGDPLLLRRLLEASWNGLVVIDTKSDLGVLTQSALAASDLALVVVSDQTSLEQAERIYALLGGFGKPRERAHIVLSLVDRRVKYRAGDDADILALLLAEIRRREHPCLASFLSRSPKIESLYTSGERRAHAILHGAPGSLVHRQMAHLAGDVLRLLEAEGPAPGAERRRGPRRPFTQRVAGFSGGPQILVLRGRDLSPGGIAFEPSADLARAERVHLALAPESSGDRLLVWAKVVRREPDRVALCFEVGADAGLRGRLERFVAGLCAAPAQREAAPA